MKQMKLFGMSVVMAALLLSAAPALATFQLQITEIWPGQDGPDLTADWFEIYNSGTMAWTSAGDGILTVNDNSGGLLDDVLVQNIPSIAAGETVIVLMESSPIAPAPFDPTTFYNVWDPVKDLDTTQIGWADGSGLGLGQAGDSVNIWVANVLQDTESYTAAGGANSGRSWDVLLGAYSTVGNASGAVATIATAGTSGLEPAIASPGMIVPEPGSVLLMSIGGVALGLFARRRMKR